MHSLVARSSPSSLALYAECARRWRYEYLERLRPRREPVALAFGSWAHECLAAYYAGKDPMAALNAIIEEAEPRLAAAWEANEFAWTVAVLRGMFTAYPAWAKAHEGNFKVLGVEKEGTYLGGQYRLDALVEVVDGPNAGRWVLEHKTSALGHGDVHEDTAQIAVQPRFYVAAEGALGIIYNILSKPAVRQRQRESEAEFFARVTREYTEQPDKYFTRSWVRVDSSDTEQMIADSRVVMEASIANNAFPQNSRACYSRGRCPFLPLCNRLADVDDLYERRPERTQ